jgi:hypothetical protein
MEIDTNSKTITEQGNIQHQGNYYFVNITIFIKSTFYQKVKNRKIIKFPFSKSLYSFHLP